MRKLTLKEKVYVGIVVFLFVVLLVKSVWFDPIKVQDEGTQKIVDQVQAVIDEVHDGFVYNTGIVKIRIIEVKPDGPEDFKGHYRKYFAGFFPIGDTYFSSKDEKNTLQEVK